MSLQGKKVIITGATSGIGRELALQLSKKGCVIGATGRREHLLEELADEASSRLFIKLMDVSKPEEAQQQLSALIKEMGGLDIIVLNAGISLKNSEFEWEPERKLIDTNVTGFCALLNTAYHHFAEQQSGHIVGISSIASLLPNPGSMGYNASKAFISNYIQGVRLRINKSGLPIYVTDILPGFIYTPMTEHRSDMFWVSTVDKATHQIVRAIEKKKFKAYISRRWFWVAFLIRNIPHRLWRWLV